VGGGAARGKSRNAVQGRPMRTRADPLGANVPIKAKNPNKPSSSLEKGPRHCEPQRLRPGEITVNKKFALHWVPVGGGTTGADRRPLAATPVGVRLKCPGLIRGGGETGLSFFAAVDCYRLINVEKYSRGA